MKDGSDNPQRNVGRDVKTDKRDDGAGHDARAATRNEGLARSGGTPDAQRTSGAHYGGGTKITSEEQGKIDAHGSAGASGPPGAARRPSNPGSEKGE